MAVVQAARARSDVFPDTRTSALVSLKGPDPEKAASARRALVEVYWQPVYRHLRLRWRKSADESMELTQAFFAKALEKDYLDRYDAERGRFRAYLKTCLDRFAVNADVAAHRQKRGAHLRLGFDFASVEEEINVAAPTPEDLLDGEFDRVWAAVLLDLGVADLRASCEERGKTTTLTLFERYALEPDVDARPTYRALADELGISVHDVTNQLAYARREFKRLVLDRLREITVSDEEFELEARAVLGVG